MSSKPIGEFICDFCGSDKIHKHTPEQKLPPGWVEFKYEGKVTNFVGQTLSNTWFEKHLCPQCLTAVKSVVQDEGD